MKIAIQGHATRGKEVIQIFESLGGKNINGLTGNDITFYYINNKNEISSDHKDNFPLIYNFYTLEIFEKEFPFKIGDKVIHEEYDSPFEIIQFDPENVYPYAIDGVCEFRTKSCTLTKYQPKMKEERNITLTLDKAKEWYKKGGELKEVALQAYSEEELTKIELPKTWEEFCENYPIKTGEFYIDTLSEIRKYSKSDESRDIEIDKNICPSKKLAEAHLAMIQLEQLRDCWRQGWIPTPGNNSYAIKVFKKDKLGVCCFYSREFLSFPTKEMAEEFLECFRDLIEKAGDLI